MASLIQNYVNSLQTIQNPFVYGYNGLNNRMEDASIQKHGVGSFGTTGSFDTEKLALMLEKMLGFPNSYLPPTQHFKMPMAPSNAVCRETNIWCGELPPRNYCNPVFSPKVFIGGIPWDISELTLLDAFLPYGVCKVEWPGNSNLRGPKAILRNIARSKASGYVYIIFEAEQSVRALLQDCAQTFGSAGELYFRLRTRRNRTTEFRQVQVIPWVISDAMYIPQVLDVNMRPCFLDTSKTVFVGALHGMMTATILGAIMEEQFGPVVYVGINTDKNKYPIGSGRVTFTNSDSYDRAVDCEFLEIRTSKFNKKIQIDPFLEDAKCSTCVNEVAPYFCRFKSCFKYFCQRCWHVHYESEGSNFKHRMLIHNTRRMSLNSNEETLSSSGGNYVQLFRGESSEST